DILFSEIRTAKQRKTPQASRPQVAKIYETDHLYPGVGIVHKQTDHERHHRDRDHQFSIFHNSTSRTILVSHHFHWRGGLPRPPKRISSHLPALPHQRALAPNPLPAAQHGAGPAHARRLRGTPGRGRIRRTHHHQDRGTRRGRDRLGLPVLPR